MKNNDIIDRSIDSKEDEKNSGENSSNSKQPAPPDITMWLNNEDHLRIISESEGGDFASTFSEMRNALTQMEWSLEKRGREFCIHPRWGYLNASPENLGTAMRASVFIRLPRL